MINRAWKSSISRMAVVFSLFLCAGVFVGKTYGQIPPPPPRPDTCSLPDYSCIEDFDTSDCFWCKGVTFGPKCDITGIFNAPTRGYNGCMTRTYFYLGEIYAYECQQYGFQCNDDFP